MKAIKHLLIAALVALSAPNLLSPAIAQVEQGEVVAEVRVEGHRLMSTAAVMSYLRTRQGYPYSEQVVKADERRLLMTGRFQTVVATRHDSPDGVIVTFALEEWPLIERLEIEGNMAFSDTALLRELTFGVGDPLNRFNVESGRQAIVTRYQGRGYFATEVTVDEQALQQNAVVYRVVEGPQARVRKIRIEGNEHFGDWRLKQAVGQSARWWPFIAGYLDLDQIERDVLALRNLYTSEGFLDVQVGRRLEFSQDRRRVVVTFLINEGPRYRINRIEFTGNTVFSNEELSRRLNLSQGRFYTSLALRRDTEELERTYGELGYINAKVESRTRYVDPTAPLPEWASGLPEDEPGLLNLEFQIVEGEQYRVGRVEIRGNTVTQDRVIRRELRFFPGQLYNVVAVEESERRLREMWLFESVSIRPSGDDRAVRDAIVAVREGKTAEFMVGIGASTNSGLMGTVSFTQRNFNLLRWPSSWKDVTRGEAWKGAGQTLRVAAEPGTEIMRFQVELFEPYLFDQPYSLGVEGFAWNRIRDTYDEGRYGGLLSLGHRFPNRWYAEISSRIEMIEITDIDKDDSPPEVTELDGNHFLFGPKLTLVRDRTDSRWMPTTGDRLRMSHEQVMGDFDFGRINLDYSIYRTVWMDADDRKHIVAARALGGYIVGDAPLFERFYGGGLGSIRGFEFRGVSPRSRDDDFRDEPVGGDFMVLAGVEYSFPIVTDALRGVIFIDSGTVDRKFELTKYRVAAGVGLQWVIPMMGPVPLSLNFGFPISKADEDDTQVFSFSLGWSF